MYIYMHMHAYACICMHAQVSDFSCLRTLEGHSSSVLKIHWLSHGLQLLSSGSDGLIKLWSAHMHAWVHALTRTHTMHGCIHATHRSAKASE